MTLTDTTKIRDGSNFVKVVAYGIGAKLSILAIIFAFEFGWLMISTKSPNTFTPLESNNAFKFSLEN